MSGFRWKQWLKSLTGNRPFKRAPRLPLAWSIERTEPRTLLSIHSVGDINSVSRDADPRDFLQIGSITYFTADDGIHGRELWKTDGTESGTILVKDIHPSSGIYSGSYPNHLTNVGGILYFTADNGVNGTELWKSDGTESGTQLVADIQTGGAGNSSAPDGLVTLGGKLYFIADDGSTGRELWSSTGTSAGTQRITNLNPAGDAFQPGEKLVNINGQLVFAASQGAAGTQLWSSNGTSSGTVLLKTIRSGSSAIQNFGADQLAATATTVYFVANNGSTGDELWKTDGTATGTVLVKDIQSGNVSSDPRSFTLVGNTLYFLATTSTAGQELWKSDGTAGGTVIVADIRPGPSGASASNLVSFQNKLYFTANDGVAGAELWRTDGTLVGTSIVKNINTGAGSSQPEGLTVAGGTLYFTADNGMAGRELWKSDGSLNGTTLVRDINPGSAGSSSDAQRTVLGVVNNTLLFSANDGRNGLDLWSSDGTVSGTKLVKDINSVTIGSYPAAVTSFAGGVVFVANDGQNGDEIWFSNGVTGNSVMLIDANSGTAGSAPADFTPVNNILYFTAISGSLGRELWKTDGTAAGTVIVHDINPGVASSDPLDLTSFNGALYFSAVDSDSGRELWTSNGTSAGTVRVADIDAGGGSSTPELLVSTGSSLYFRANGDELWITDGTTDGTLLVLDPNPTGNSQIGELTNVGGTLFFVATNGTQGVELWTSGGTPETTQQLQDIRTGVLGSAPSELTASNGKLYFVADDGINGAELWVSNGTSVGTQLVSDLVAGMASSHPQRLTDVNGWLYFVADNGTHGLELWKSSGTSGTTQMVADIRSGAAGSDPDHLTNVNGVLYFAANDGVHGLEPWKSNGTAGGTQLASDFNPGTAGSIPSGFTAVGTALFFAADNGLQGIELVSDVANRAPSISTTQLIIPGTAVNGTVVGNISASDPDAGQMLTYTIVSGNESQAFLLNASTGQLVVNDISAIDLENDPQFSLVIRIVDNGNPAGFAQATISVGTQPANQSPVIQNQTFNLAENSANNAVVATVLASDPDSGQALTFEIIAGNASGAFAINAVTGQITVSNPTVLNFEATPSFGLTVKVTDNGTPAAASSATVTINLTNVDEPPQIALPAGGVTYIRRAAPLLVGAQAAVSDPDSPTLNFAGGTVTATISQGALTTDKLAIVAGGGIKMKGKNVLFNGTVIGKVAGGTRGSTLTVTLNANASVSAVNQVLRQIGYSNKPKKTPAAPRTIQFRVKDSGGRTSLPATQQVTLV